MQDYTLNIGFSKRTLQRDVREIRHIFGIDIEYSKAEKGYFISNSEAENRNFLRMMETFDMFNSLNLAQDLKPFIHLEKRKPQGTENLYGLLHAIKNRFQIKFTYQKFWGEAISQRLVAPYALKEFKNRWYIMAKDSKDHNIKSFALDRLTNLEITNQVYISIPIITALNKAIVIALALLDQMTKKHKTLFYPLIHFRSNISKHCSSTIPNKL